MAENNKMVENIVEEIKGIDENVTNVIVPILRDTISDYRKVVTKLIIIIVILIVSLLSLGGAGYHIIAKQVKRYDDFLSQFDYEGEVYQDLDTGEGGDAIINSGINMENNK